MPLSSFVRWWSNCKKGEQQPGSSCLHSHSEALLERKDDGRLYWGRSTADPSEPDWCTPALGGKDFLAPGHEGTSLVLMGSEKISSSGLEKKTNEDSGYSPLWVSEKDNHWEKLNKSKPALFSLSAGFWCSELHRVQKQVYSCSLMWLAGLIVVLLSLCQLPGATPVVLCMPPPEQSCRAEVGTAPSHAAGWLHSCREHGVGKGFWNCSNRQGPPVPVHAQADQQCSFFQSTWGSFTVRQGPNC